MRNTPVNNSELAVMECVKSTGFVASSRSGRSAMSWRALRPDHPLRSWRTPWARRLLAMNS